MKETRFMSDGKRTRELLKQLDNTRENLKQLRKQNPSETVALKINLNVYDLLTDRERRNLKNLCDYLFIYTSKTVYKHKDGKLIKTNMLPQ